MGVGSWQNVADRQSLASLIGCAEGELMDHLQECLRGRRVWLFDLSSISVTCDRMLARHLLMAFSFLSRPKIIKYNQMANKLFGAAPQTGALTGLRYAPNIGPHYSQRGLAPQHTPARRGRTAHCAAP
jgi:hypothetical protein